jgi:Dihydrodipicolinate synthase/N-acetylneuraminate lyase
MNNKLTYTGIIPPIVTPLTPQEELDSDALQKLISFDIENGVSGIFVNGTSGEALRLPDHVWQETMRTALAASFGRIPVFCGAIDTSTSRVIERLKTIEECGGKIAVCTPPFYLTSFGQDEILRHYDAICRSTDLEIAVYNIPETTHANILPETISRLAEYDSIVAYKDSTADWQQLQRAMILLKDKDIAVLNGAEELCCVSMLWGAGGCIPGLANFVPSLFVQLQNSCRAGCLEKARQLQEQINAIRKAIFVSGCWMAGMKGILELFGLGSRTVSQPLQAVTESQLDEIRRILTSGGVSLA